MSFHWLPLCCFVVVIVVISLMVFPFQNYSTEWMSFQQMDIARISRPRDLFPQGFHKVSKWSIDHVWIATKVEKSSSTSFLPDLLPLLLALGERSPCSSEEHPPASCSSGLASLEYDDNRIRVVMMVVMITATTRLRASRSWWDGMKRIDLYILYIDIFIPA